MARENDQRTPPSPAAPPTAAESAAQTEIRELKARLRDAEAKLAAASAGTRPEHHARAPGTYRVRLEGCRPCQATYTVGLRERLPREVYDRLTKDRELRPETYAGSTLRGEPNRAAWERYRDKHKLQHEDLRYFTIRPEAGKPQDYLDVQADSPGDAWMQFCALHLGLRSQRKWTAELLPPTPPGEKKAASEQPATAAA